MPKNKEKKGTVINYIHNKINIICKPHRWLRHFFILNSFHWNILPVTFQGPQFQICNGWETKSVWIQRRIFEHLLMCLAYILKCKITTLKLSGYLYIYFLSKGALIVLLIDHFIRTWLVFMKQGNLEKRVGILSGILSYFQNTNTWLCRFRNE